MSANEESIDHRVQFSQIAELLEKVKNAGQQKDELLRKFFRSFEKFRLEYAVQNGAGRKSSFFPILRLLLPAADRERDSYGLRYKALMELYIRILALNKNSADVQHLLSGDESTDFAERICKLTDGRCPRESSLTVAALNRHLDAIGEHTANGRRSQIQDELIKMIECTTSLDQKWIVRIILKNLRLGMAQRKLLQLYHVNAPILYESYSDLSKVCEVIESVEKQITPERITSTAQQEASKPDIPVALFHPVKAMLCRRVDLGSISQLLRKAEYWLETKMDGERFQIHSDMDIFRYYSRNTFEYSATFGERANQANATLTPFLAPLFTDSVRSVILDGEMMVFDKVELKYRDKCENTDVKSIKASNPDVRPCFCVYDILHFNGRSLANLPYVERMRLLPTVIREQVGVMSYCNRVKVRNGEHFVELLNNAIDSRQEGVVIKKQESVYAPNLRNAGWYKIKPDYIENLVTEFDLLILGGFYNFRRTFINTYLVGVFDGEPQDEVAVYAAVVKVRNGLSVEQGRQLNALLEPHWQPVLSRKEGRSTIYETVECIRWGESPPDVWIKPEKSIILQLKGSELVTTTMYGTGYTIRFPRITAVRNDKHFQETCFRQEFDALCASSVHSGGKVVKLTKHHVTFEHLNISNEKRSNKRKSVSALQLYAAKVTAEEKPIDQICKGLDFCVLSTVKGQNSIFELETLIRRHGGNVVSNPGGTTYAIIAGDRTYKVERYIERNKWNIVKVDWLLRALHCTEARDQLLPMRPYDFLAMTDATKLQLAEQYDRYGDSYTEKVELTSFWQFITRDCVADVRLTGSELVQAERYILGASSRYKIFRGLTGRLCEDSGTQQPANLERYKAMRCMLRFTRNGGQWLTDDSSGELGYRFFYPGASSDCCNVTSKTLRIEWITKSLELGRLCNEQDFAIEDNTKDE